MYTYIKNIYYTMPGFNIRISYEELESYKNEHPFGDIPLRSWVIKHRKIPHYQNIHSVSLDNLDLEGMNLSFVDFQDIIIKDCEVDKLTKVIGANFNNTIILNTPLGELRNLGYTTMSSMVIDEESSANINNTALSAQRESLLKRVIQCQKLLVAQNKDELKEIIDSIQDPFEANVAIKFYNVNNQQIPLNTNTTPILSKKIFTMINDHPKIKHGVTIQEIQAVTQVITEQSKNLVLYPEDLDRICTECIDKIIDGLNKDTPLEKICTQATELMHTWKNITLEKQYKFAKQIEIVAKNKSIRETALKITTYKSTSDKIISVIKDSLYEVFVKSKEAIIGGIIGGTLGITQSSSLTGAMVKGSAGAALGAIAMKKIPKSISPFEASDWPTINPTDIEARNRDIALKIRGLFWCTMLAGGSIEGLSGQNLGILPISTIVSSFETLKEVLPLKGLASTELENPEKLNEFISEELNPKSKTNFLYQCKKFLATHSDKLDSQLGDRLLEAGTIMEQLELRLNIVLANRQLMQITQIGNPGLLGNLLNTGESIQNFFSLWSIKNNYLAISETLKKEKDKTFMERQRPGSKEFTKIIEKKMFLQKVTANSILSVAALSITFTLGIPLFGAAATVLGAPTAIVAISAVFAIASTAYIAKSYFSSPIKAPEIKLNKHSQNTVSSTLTDGQHNKMHSTKTKPHKSSHQNTTEQLTQSSLSSHPSFVEHLRKERTEQSYKTKRPKSNNSQRSKPHKKTKVSYVKKEHLRKEEGNHQDQKKHLNF